MAEVRLVDLVVIKRYSLAVRQEWAAADDVLAALDASRDQVLAALEQGEGGRPQRRAGRAGRGTAGTAGAAGRAPRAR